MRRESEGPDARGGAFLIHPNGTRLNGDDNVAVAGVGFRWVDPANFPLCDEPDLCMSRKASLFSTLIRCHKCETKDANPNERGQPGRQSA